MLADDEFFFAAKSLFDWEMFIGAEMMELEIRAYVERNFVIVDADCTIVLERYDC